MSKEIKDINAPSRWNMRIWDDDNKEWLCQSDGDNLTYYGFDITGGEITEFQGLPKWHPDRHLIWEQSTGLKDKNGKEIYEGDIVKEAVKGRDKTWEYIYEVKWEMSGFYPFADSPNNCQHCGGGIDMLDERITIEVIGNIHEKPKEFRPEHLKRMGVTMMEGKGE